MNTKTSAKRLLSMLLVLIMALTLLPTAALATAYDGWDDSQPYSSGDTITIDGKNYTYKGDVSESVLDLAPNTESGNEPLTGNLVYKAGNGYILFSYDGSTAAVTLRDATSSMGIKLPFSMGNAVGDEATACDTTVTLEGNSTLSGSINHNAGTTIFTGSGSLTVASSSLFCGAVTVKGGAQLTLGGDYFSVYGLLTVEDGGKLTVPTDTELQSGEITDPVAYPGEITVNGGTLENNGRIEMLTKTAADPGIAGNITGSGVVMFGIEDIRSYIQVGGEWVVYGGDATIAGLNLTIVPTVKTGYRAGEGTIVFTPAAGGDTPTLTFSNATIDAAEVRIKGAYTLALNGTNNIGSIFVLRLSDDTGSGTTSPLTIAATEGASLTAPIITACSVNGDTSALNALTSTNNGFVFYGTYEVPNGKLYEEFISVDANATVTVNGNSVEFEPASSSQPSTFTNSGKIIINNGKTMNLSKCTTITSSGTIENNGTLVLPDITTGEQIGSLNLTGDGIVKVGTKAYLNDGTEVNVISGDLDCSSTDSLPLIDGYVLNESTKTLTLNNIVVTGNIILPDADYTIVIDGIAKAQRITFSDVTSKKNITISGGKLNCSSIDLQGNLTIDEVTMTGGVSNTNTSGEGVLTMKNSTWNTGSLSWMTNGGIALENSSLTIEEGDNNQFWTEKIVMDDDSVINMGCPLKNENKVSGGMNGIEKYLSNGYSLGIINGSNTILDANGNIVSRIVLQLIPVYTLNVNLNGGNGGTIGGEYAKDDVVTIDAGSKSGYIFSGWTSANGGAFADAGSESTTFTMPAEATTITANWTYHCADYSGVDAAIANIPSDLTPYTEETVKAVNDAKEAVVRDKNITEQTIVDGYATAINEAVSSLEKKKVGPESPHTEDNSNMALWIALLFISGGAVSVLGITQKRRKAK